MCLVFSMKVNPCKTRGRYYKGHVEMQKRKLGKTLGKTPKIEVFLGKNEVR